MYDIDQIEDAIITALEPLKISLGVRTVKSYGGELEQDDFRRLQDPVPAIYVVYGGGRNIDHERRQIKQMAWFVFVIDKCLRSEAETRRGGLNNPGTYAMLREVEKVLNNKNLGLEIYNLTLQDENFVGYVAGLSIYAAQYNTSQMYLAPIA